MDANVGDRRRWQVLRERLPVASAVEGDKRAELRAGVEQTLACRVLADNPGRVIEGDAVVAVGQQRPALAVVLRLVDVWLQIVFAQIAIDGGVGGAFAMRRILD